MRDPCFHRFFMILSIFHEGKKCFSNKMNPLGCFSAEEGKEISRGGSGEEVTPPGGKKRGGWGEGGSIESRTPDQAACW